MYDPPRRRLLYILFTGTILLLVLAVRRLGGSVSSEQVKATWGWKTTPEQDVNPNGQMPSFQDIALEYGTDKVIDHRYQFLYEKYLPPLRDVPVKMLEIGLGCDKERGPGASYHTWLAYFPKLHLYFIDSNDECSKSWSESHDRALIFVGDQGSVPFLEQFAAQATVHGLFDLVVDDGGGHMHQQELSLTHLWRIVKPGGVYIVEDLQTSYQDAYGGDPSTNDGEKRTMMKFVYELMDDVMGNGAKHAMSSQIRRIDCMAEICAFVKKEGGTR